MRESGDSVSTAKALNLLGQVHARIPNYTVTERGLTEALSLYEKINDRQNIARVLGNLADLDRRTSRFAAAIENGFRALNIDEQFDDHRETAKACDVLGNAFHYMGQCENAVRSYQRGLDERLKLNPKQDLAFSYRNIGGALVDLGKNAEALDYYHKSLEEGTAAGDALAGAERDFEEALAIAEQRGYRDEKGLVLYNLGNLFQTTGDLDKALDYHQRALKAREQNGTDEPPSAATRKE